MNPAGITTGVPAGLAGLDVAGGGVGEAAGSSREKRFTRTIPDAIAIIAAPMARIASPRCSHLRSPFAATGSASAATGSSVAPDHEGCSGLASEGRGASLVDRV